MKIFVPMILLVALAAPLIGQSAVGINLSPTNYYQTDFPFVNLAKSGEWRNLDWSYLAGSSLTAQAYLPQGRDGLFLVIVDSKSFPWGTSPATLVFSYSGAADIEVVGGAVVKSRNPGRLVLSLPERFQGNLAFRITRHRHQLGDFRLTEASEEKTPALFRESYLEQWKAFRTLRFMDLMHTNGSPFTHEEDYPGVDSLLESPAIRLESMTELCNALQADAWVCLPHLADDALVRRIAIAFRDRLDPGLRVFIEYSNECWNDSFPQANYCEVQGRRLGLDADSDRAGQKYYAQRAAQIHEIWDQLWGEQAIRLVRVVAWQAYNARHCDAVLDAYRQVRGAEADRLAVAPYFGFSLGTSNPGARFADEVQSWSLDELFSHLGSTTAFRLSGGHDDGSLAEVRRVVEGVAAVARKHRLRLVAYEAGQHLVGVGSWGGNESLKSLFVAANRDPRMGDLYRRYLDLWRSAGGQEILLFSSSGSPGPYGSWGLKESSNHHQNRSPKYAAALAWIAANPRWF